MDLPEIFRDFKQIEREYELRRTLEVVVRDTTYRIEVLYCYSNENSPWFPQVYSRTSSNWKHLPHLGWVSERSEELAIRLALSFITD